jgi:hypothetical protein
LIRNALVFEFGDSNGIIFDGLLTRLRVNY